MARLNAIYPKIGDDATTPTKLDFGNINSGTLTTPTAVKATATSAIAGVGFVAITINGSDFNLLTTLD